MRLGGAWLEMRRLARQHVTLTPHSRRLFRAAPPELDSVQHDVLTNLAESGIAMISFDELFGSSYDELWRSLLQDADAFAASDKVRDSARRLADAGPACEHKAYIVRRFEDGAAIPCDHPLLLFALSERVLSVVNAFLGMYARLNYCNLWCTLPVDSRLPRLASQRWHRDPEDVRLVKVFLYFTDVDENSGPLEYIPESRQGGKLAHLWRFASGAGVGGYPDQQKVEAAVARTDRVVAVGRRGTVVFCDTTGLHRGGKLHDGTRTLGNFAYVTPASLYPRKFRCLNQPSSLFPPAAHYAIA